jgi:hypothetical protein
VPYDAAVTKGVVRAKDKINLPPSARYALEQQARVWLEPYAPTSRAVPVGLGLGLRWVHG